jgi:serine/threonine-protein kinase
VLHQIGTGSLGPVFRGEDTETDERVAIKHLKLKIGPERTRFIAEDLCALIEKLPSHPAVPRELHAGTHAGDPYIVYALAAGESLDLALREYGPAVIADALPRLERLADALDAAAAAGICHGALHPHDVIVSARETKMTGLGVAGVLERAGVQVPSRAPYSAPEVEVSHQGSPAGDQYSLAALAHAWLTGQTISGPAEGALTLPAMPGVEGERLAKAFTTALAANPADRFPTCGAFVDAVRDSARASPPSATGAAAVLPFESEQEDEPAGAATLTIPGPVEPPRTPAPIVELRMDAEPPKSSPSDRPDPLPVPVSLTQDADRTVKWRGSLSPSPEPVEPSSSSGFSLGALVAVLLVGIAIGIAGGYLLAGGRGSRSARAADATPAAGANTPAAAQVAPDVPVAASANATPSATETPATHAGGTTPETAATAPPKTAAGLRREGAAAPPAKRETARLLVRTKPAGASVTVDGTVHGKSPVALRDLELGTRTIVITRPGYVTAERRITLTADRPSRSIDVSLAPVTAAPRAPARSASAPAPANATSGLVVDSRPTGATVTIDGTPAGTTPLTVPTIAPGVHRVVIEKEGYQPWTTTVDVKPGERPRVAASLQGGNERE